MDEYNNVTRAALRALQINTKGMRRTHTCRQTAHMANGSQTKTSMRGNVIRGLHLNKCDRQGDKLAPARKASLNHEMR